MNELDIDSLQAIQLWASNQIEKYERQKRMEPVWDAFQQSIGLTTSAKDMISEAQENAEKSLASLENSVAEFPAKMAAEEARRGKVMASTRQRTNALHRWLEALS